MDSAEPKLTDTGTAGVIARPPLLFPILALVVSYVVAILLLPLALYLIRLRA